MPRLPIEGARDPKLERLIRDAAVAQPQQQQVSPIVTMLDSCHVEVVDETLGGQPVKAMLFIHASGVVAWKAVFPLPAAQRHGRMLVADPAAR